MNGIFISAINTDSGKTWITSKLIQKLSLNSNLNQLNPENSKNFNGVIAIKPVQSGFIDKTNPNSDSAILLSAQLKDKPNLKIDDICLHSFKDPIAPNLAAKNQEIDYSTDDLIDFCQKQTTEYFALIEGAGGLFSPISQDGFNYDIAKGLNIPTLLILNDELGCISQTIAHLIAAKEMKVDILAIVINQFDKKSPRKTKQELSIWSKKLNLNQPILSVSRNETDDKLNKISEEIITIWLKNRAN